MCDCIDKIRFNLGESKTMHNVELKTARMYDFEKETHLEKAGKLKFTYHNVTRSGTTAKRTESSFITFDFCPFCGQRYVFPDKED